MRVWAWERGCRTSLSPLFPLSFILKLQVFQPYAKHWLPGLTQFIVGGKHGGEGMHYFVVDLMVTMLSWATTAVLEVCIGWDRPTHDTLAFP